MKVLIVRFAAIGDCVMTSWAVTALRRAQPEAEIVWAVQERCAPAIDDKSLVNNLHIFPRERWKKNRWSPATWADQIVKYTSLRKRCFDVGFDFQGHSKTALCLRLSGCAKRYASRATDALAARLTEPSILKPEGPHEVQRAMALIRQEFEVDQVELPIMPDYRIDMIDDFSRDHKNKPLVTIQTGAGEKDKTYSKEKWESVACALIEQGCFVVAIGGPKDPQLASKGVKNTAGTLRLEDSLALVRASKLHLAADTGTGHAAAAYGVPVVSIFGRTDPERFRPWTQQGAVLRQSSNANDVSPSEVIEAALGLLKEHSASTH